MSEPNMLVDLVQRVVNETLKDLPREFRVCPVCRERRALAKTAVACAFCNGSGVLPKLKS